MIIAIDGLAASGKGSIARAIADIYGWPHLDTGKLYRKTAFSALEANVDLQDRITLGQIARRLELSCLEDPALMHENISAAASHIAKFKEVRDGLLDLQRQFGERSELKYGGAVLDGRDIGTVIFPDADLKLYVIADIKIRAARRKAQLDTLGQPADLAEIMQDLAARDIQDGDRKIAPAKKAANAHLLDTSHASIDEVVSCARNLIDTKLPPS